MAMGSKPRFRPPWRFCDWSAVVASPALALPLEFLELVSGQSPLFEVLKSSFMLEVTQLPHFDGVAVVHVAQELAKPVGLGIDIARGR